MGLRHNTPLDLLDCESDVLCRLRVNAHVEPMYALIVVHTLPLYRVDRYS